MLHLVLDYGVPVSKLDHWHSEIDLWIISQLLDQKMQFSLFLTFCQDVLGPSVFFYFLKQLEDQKIILNARHPQFYLLLWMFGTKTWLLLDDRLNKHTKCRLGVRRPLPQKREQKSVNKTNTINSHENKKTTFWISLFWVKHKYIIQTQ